MGGYPHGKVSYWKHNPDVEGIAVYCVAHGCKTRFHWHYRDFKCEELPDDPELTWDRYAANLVCRACGTKGEVNIVPRWKQWKPNRA